MEAKTPKRLKTVTYENLKQRIISGIYLPGTMLNEEQITNELKVSRTPIRDAFSRLEQEGFVIIKPKRGVLVSPLSIEEINAVFEARMLYEQFAIINYGHMISEIELMKSYQFCLHPDPNMDSFQADEDFHSCIMKTVRNPYILHSYEIINIQNKRLRILTGKCNDERLKETYEEHIKIITACLKHDRKEASDQMREHLLKSKFSAIDYLLKHPIDSIKNKAIVANVSES